MTNKEKFLALVTEKDTTFTKEVEKRIKNAEMLRESQNIAFKVLFRLNELGWSQKDLAEAMNVKPQHINRIVKGKENITLETQIKIQSILNIPILASYIEKQQSKKAVILYKNITKYNLINLSDRSHRAVGKRPHELQTDKIVAKFEYSDKMSA